MLGTTAQLVASARAAGRPLLAFNVITLEHAEAIASAADLTGRPVLLQLSQNAVRYHGGPAALAVAALTVAASASVEIGVHLDHIEDDELWRAAPNLGVSSVMVDFSTRSDDANIAATRDAAAWLHERGLFVEAELGAIGGKGGAHTPGVRTDPAEAAAFVTATGVDALAVAVGSEHAMTSRTGSIDRQLVRALAAAVPVPLVLHGSSGIPDAVLREAAAAGIVKINIGTLLNVSFTAAVRDALGDRAVVDPRKYLGPGRDAVTAAVAGVIEALA